MLKMKKRDLKMLHHILSWSWLNVAAWESTLHLLWGGIRGGVLHPVNRLIFAPNPITDKVVSPQNPIPPILAPKITFIRLNLP